MARLIAPVVALALLGAACSSSTPQAASVSSPQAIEEAPSPDPTPAPSATTSPSEDSATPEQAPTATPAPAPSPTPQMLPPSPVAETPPDWETCGALQCAWITVPVDHDNPDGPGLDLRVIRAAGTSEADRIGSLFINPGGPGGSGVAFLSGFVSSAPADLRARFDLVSWDPRGVGQSSGLRCEEDVASDLNEVTNTLDGIRDDLDRFLEDTRALGEACRAVGGDLVDHVGTVATVRDLDMLRAALGDNELTYLGYSYGTRIGSVYATLFPTAVRAMVLDGAFPPGLTSTELALNAADLEAVVWRIDRVCNLEDSCPLAGPGLVNVFNRLRDSLGTEPTGAPLGLSDRSTLIGATLLAVYVPEAWASYVAALAAADTGDLGPIYRMAASWFGKPDGTFRDVFLGSNTAIMCADEAYPSTVAGTAVDAEATLQASPLLGDVFAGASCVGWPAVAEPLPTGPPLPTRPLVVIGGSHDPATPLRWARRMTADLANATLVTYDGDGHTVVANGNGCIDSMISAYLTEGTVPASGLECSAESGIVGMRVRATELGLVVDAVDPGAAAASAGVVPGDLIQRVDGEPARSSSQVTTFAGQVLKLDIERSSGSVSIDVTALRRPWMLPPD